MSPVNLSGGTTLDVTLNNTLSDLPIGLYPDVTVSPGQQSYWQGNPQAVVHLPRSGSRVLDAGLTVHSAVVLNLRPNPWHALGASIFPLWSLILSVLVGAIAGSLLAQLGKKTSADGMKWYKAFAVALLASGIAEVFGIILVYGGSEFRLFGFELDPYQLLPVAAVGALVGLVGFRNADDFLRFFQES